MAGGLATTTTIVRADFWRFGQCRPGDSIRFKRISWDSALVLRQRTEKYIAQAHAFVNGELEAAELRSIDTTLPGEWEETILHRTAATPGSVEIKYRQVSCSAGLSLMLGGRLPYSRHIWPDDCCGSDPRTYSAPREPLTHHRRGHRRHRRRPM